MIQLPPVSLDIPKLLANKLEDDCYNIKRRKKVRLISLIQNPQSVTILIMNFFYLTKIVLPFVPIEKILIFKSLPFVLKVFYETKVKQILTS